jgi:hypothetical protein
MSWSMAGWSSWRPTAFGGDSGHYYTGSYKVDGATLEVDATIERHNPAWNVWGDQAPKFDIQFTGRRRDGGSVIEGRMRRLEMPSLSIPVIWFRMRDLP